jgi:lipopolysaccharide transport system ATP-binding protein
MSEVVIRTDNLGKQYRIGGQQNEFRTLRDSLTDAFVAPFRRARKLLRGQPSGAADMSKTIWALNGVSLEIKRGEVVGIIGSNGAGKTTLLKILCRITEPTEGYAEIHGRVGSLLEVGTGFHPELTGRENIYLNGAILGMKKAEIEQKFDQIVDFAEIEKFIYTPVKHYSSGMYVRLAFAVAAHLEPEILLVDEVLAVGDVAFQKKCLGKMEDVASEGRTVLFVSHNMAAVNRLCLQGMWLDEGRLQMMGSAERVVAAYLSKGAEEEGERSWENLDEAPGNDNIRLRAVRVLNSHAQVSSTFDVRLPIRVEIEYEVFSPLSNMRVGFRLITSDGVIVFDARDTEDQRWQGKTRSPGKYVSTCEIPGMFLNSGTYLLTVGSDIPFVETLFFEDIILTFNVQQTGIPSVHDSEHVPGVICPSLKWAITKLIDMGR